MNYEEIRIGDFSIVGISVRTTNKDGKSVEDIQKLWTDFFSNNVADDISDRLSEDIYCMYTDYESDHHGEYTVILGYKVSDTNEISGEYYYKDIPAGKYYKFEAEGKIPECVGKTWDYIWKSDFKRSYIADFDVYSAENAFNPEKAKVTTYLSIE